MVGFYELLEDFPRWAVGPRWVRIIQDSVRFQRLEGETIVIIVGDGFNYVFQPAYLLLFDFVSFDLGFAMRR